MRFRSVVSLPAPTLALLLLASAPAAQWVEPGVVPLVHVPGPAIGDLFGWRTRQVGDANQDGVPDFAVATPFYNLNVGRISLCSGATGAELWGRAETRTSAIFGFDLAVVPDMNGDGVRDVVASAPFASGTTGVVHVLSGMGGAILRTFNGTATGGALGYALAAGGDFNGDGVEDLAIANPDESAVRSFGGRVVVYSTQGFGVVATLDGPAGQQSFGQSLALVGDVNGDGRSELAVGMLDSISGTIGKVQLLSWNGTAAAVLWTFPGVDFGTGIGGNILKGGGDVDGDGKPDVMVGESFPTHRARLLSGTTGVVLRTFTGSAGDSTGSGARIVRDLNGDGFAECLVGANASAVGAAGGGRLTLYSGRDFRVLRTITSTIPNAHFAGDYELFDDRNGDGFPELLVGASGASGFTRSAGAVYLIQGDPCLAGRTGYGAGLAGTSGVPELSAGGDPMLGTTVQLMLGNSQGSATACALLLGTSATSVATPWGGTLLVTPGFVLPLSLPATGLVLPLSVPNDPALCLGIACLQNFVLDTGGSAGVAESRGLRLVLGH